MPGGRGRPKKVAEPVESEEGEVEETKEVTKKRPAEDKEDGASPAKRGRGRPKKKNPKVRPTPVPGRGR